LFYRQKFVTNSSSSSFIAFGIELDRGTMVDICTYYVEKNTAKALEIINSWPNVDSDAFLGDPGKYLEENDMDYEFLEAVLPTGTVYMELPPDGDRFYLCIGFPHIGITETGVTFIHDDQALVDGYQELMDIIVGVGLDEQIQIVEDNWYS
jgi:hypothetical protein